MQLDGVEFSPLKRYVPLPYKINLKVQVFFNMSYDATVREIQEKSDFDPLAGGKELGLTVRDTRWYLVAKRAHQKTGVVSIVGWNFIENDMPVTALDFRIELGPDSIAVPDSKRKPLPATNLKFRKWAVDTRMDLLFMLDLRIPLTVGGSIYLKAPPNWKFICPLQVIVQAGSSKDSAGLDYYPEQEPLCVFEHPLLQGCKRYANEIEKITYEIEGYQNRTVFLAELFKKDSAEMTPEEREIYVSESVNGTLAKIAERQPVLDELKNATKDCHQEHEVLLMFRTPGEVGVDSFPLETTMPRRLQGQDMTEQVALPIGMFKFYMRVLLPKTVLSGKNRHSMWRVIMLDASVRTLDNNLEGIVVLLPVRCATISSLCSVAMVEEQSHDYREIVLRGETERAIRR